MADRTDYMREYMRKRREKSKTEACKQKVSIPAVQLTEERLRAIIREEIERAMEPIRELLTELTVSSVNDVVKQADPLTGVDVNTVSTSAEPSSYWRPNPDLPADPRCQAKNRNGKRCKEKTAAVIRAPYAQGRMAEFGACHRHQADFLPHPGVLNQGGG